MATDNRRPQSRRQRQSDPQPAPPTRADLLKAAVHACAQEVGRWHFRSRQHSNQCKGMPPPGMYWKRGGIRLFKSWTLVRLRGAEVSG